MEEKKVFLRAIPAIDHFVLVAKQQGEKITTKFFSLHTESREGEGRKKQRRRNHFFMYNVMIASCEKQ